MAAALFGKSEALSQSPAAKPQKRSAWNGGAGLGSMTGLFGN
jgi:hypothetical protein